MPSTVKESCQWQLHNRASDCWTIVPATVEELRWRLLNNLASDCCASFWTVEQSCQWLLKIYTSHCWWLVPTLLKNHVSDCWKNCTSDCWWIVPTAVEQSFQSCQLFLTYFGKTLPSFSCKYFSYIYYFNSVCDKLSKLQDYWLIIIFYNIFIIYVLPTFATFQKLNQTQ